MKISYIWKTTLFCSICLVSNITGHPTDLGKVHQKQARLSKSKFLSSQKLSRSQRAHLALLVQRLNHKRW